MLTIEVNNSQYENFNRLSVNFALDNFDRAFSLNVSGDVFDQQPISRGNQIKIYADEKIVLTGFAHRVQREYTPKNDIVTVNGFSRTNDLIKSTIDHRVEFVGQQSLKTVTETLVSYLISESLPPDELAADPEPGTFVAVSDPLGFDVIVEADISDYLENESLSENVGDTYFSVLEKFARKRQVILATNGSADIVYTRGAGNNSSNFKLRNIRPKSVENNLLEGRITYDETELYNVYDANSQPQKGELRRIATITPENLIAGDGRVIDPVIRATKKYFFITESNSTSEQCQNRAQWEAVIRKGRSVDYLATVQGHSQNGNTWDVNQIVNVIDDQANIVGDMLINSIQFIEDVSSSVGSRTLVGCLPSNAYSFVTQEARAKIEGEVRELSIGLPVGPF